MDIRPPERRATRCSSAPARDNRRSRRPGRRPQSRRDEHVAARIFSFAHRQGPRPADRRLRRAGYRAHRPNVGRSSCARAQCRARVPSCRRRISSSTICISKSGEQIPCFHLALEAGPTPALMIDLPDNKKAAREGAASNDGIIGKSGCGGRI